MQLDLFGAIAAPQKQTTVKTKAPAKELLVFGQNPRPGFSISRLAPSVNAPAVSAPVKVEAPAPVAEVLVEAIPSPPLVLQPQGEEAIPGGDVRITSLDQVHSPGILGKIKANIKALQILAKIKTRIKDFATSEEQEDLLKWSGWGPTAKILEFHPPEDLQPYREHLERLLPAPLEDSLAKARRASLSSFYTSPEIAMGLWEGLRNLGFKGGNILEPASGSGIFLGTMPTEIRAKSRIFACDNEPLSAKLTSLLYPSAQVVCENFQDLMVIPESFDLVITNVPFMDCQVVDPEDAELRGLNASLHDYFFAKSLKCLKPGGLLVAITSHWTLDKTREGVRRWLAERAELLGACRLPSEAFSSFANTQVITDIIVLQKNATVNTNAGHAWISSSPFGNEEELGYEPHPLNRIFWPETQISTVQVMGDLKVTGPQGRFHRSELVCKGSAENLRDRVAGFMRELSLDQPLPRLEEDERSLFSASGTYFNNPLNLPELSLVHDKGCFYCFAKEKLYLCPTQFTGKAGQRLADALKLRDILWQLMMLQRSDASDAEIEGTRKRLNNAYDFFVRTWGYITQPGTRSLKHQLRLDHGTGPYLMALEKYDAEKKQYLKAGIFTHRTQVNEKVLLRVNSAAEALAASIGNYGSIRADFFAQVYKPLGACIQELGDTVFMDPETMEWVPAFQYLSGPVRKKLGIARRAAENDDAFVRNVNALEANQPEEIGPARITVGLGASWVPGNVYEDFLGEEVGCDWTFQKINSIGEFSISWKGYPKPDYAIRGEAAHRPATWLIEKIFKGGAIAVTSTDSVTNQVTTHQEETAAANYKADILKEKFISWLWAHPKHGPACVEIFNNLYNDYKKPIYDGSCLLQTIIHNGQELKLLPGQNPAIRLRKHQIDGALRGVLEGATLLHHTVGTGKTWTCAASIMIARRMGLVNKAFVIVPNHVFSQFSHEFLDLFPAAKLLVVDPKDMTKETRPNTVAKIATYDWDAIIIAESVSTKIPLSPEFQREFFSKQKLRILAEKNLSESGGSDSAAKRMAKVIERIDARLEKLGANWHKDRGPYFDNLGIDALVMDEAHTVKNLYLPSGMREGGVNTAHDVQKAWDAYMKTEFLHSTHGKIIFATGTPVTNSMSELYVMMVYLIPQKLKEMELSSFDNWVKCFGLITADLETSVDGDGLRVKSRLRKFVNVHGLQKIWQSFADTVRVQDTEIELPEIKGGKSRKIVLERNDFQIDYIESLKDRIDAIKNKDVEPYEDNMLKVVNDGRKLALDQRLIDPNVFDDEGSKINACVKEAVDIWHESAEHKAVQIIWCDMGTPAKRRSAPRKAIEIEPEYEVVEEKIVENAVDAEESMMDMDVEAAGEEGSIESICLYHDIKAKLIDKGIPENQIAYIHDCKTKEQRDAMFSALRAGSVRIIIASTAKLSTGANIQERLVGMHHLNPAWRPADLEQRLGRMVRQGNKMRNLGGVHNLIYITTGSFDSYMWQTLENKASFLDAFFLGKDDIDVMDNIDFASEEFAELKAAACADPRVMEFAKLQVELKRMDLERRSLEAEKYTWIRKIQYFNDFIPKIVESLTAAKALAESLPEEITLDKILWIRKGDIDPTPFETNTDLGKEINNLFHGSLSSVPKAIATIGEITILASNAQVPVQGSMFDTARGIRYALRNNDGTETVVPNLQANTSPVQFGNGLIEKIKKMKHEPEKYEYSLETAQRSMKQVEEGLASSQEWSRLEEYDGKVRRLKELEGILNMDSEEKKASIKSPLQIFNEYEAQKLIQASKEWALKMCTSHTRYDPYNDVTKARRTLENVSWTDMQARMGLIQETEKLVYEKYGKKNSIGKNMNILAEAISESDEIPRVKDPIANAMFAIACLSDMEQAIKILGFDPKPVSLYVPHRYRDNYKNLRQNLCRELIPDIADLVILNRWLSLDEEIPKNFTADTFRKMYKALNGRMKAQPIQKLAA